MKDEQIQKLEELRAAIINEVAPLGNDSEDLPPSQRVELLMISAETAEDPVPLVAKAHEIAQNIENVRERADVLMDLLGSIEALLIVPDGNISEGEDEPDTDTDTNPDVDLTTSNTETPEVPTGNTAEAQPIPEEV